MQKNSSKGFITILLIGIIVLGGFLFVGGRNIFRDIKKPVSPEQTYRIDNSSLSMNSEKSLQLDNFGFIALSTNTPTPPGATPTNTPPVTPTNTPPLPRTPSPTPTNPIFPPPATPSPTSPAPTQPFITPPPGVHYCISDIPRDATCECDTRMRAKPGRFCSVTDYCYYDESPDGCADHIRRGCIDTCVEKPIIYLYPTKITMVDVVIKVPGKIVISDPLYPIDGWRNVEAHPDGTLFYQGKKYKELFYESSVSSVLQPKSGVFIPREHLGEKLGEYISQLGLIGTEYKDFMDYWISRLQKLDKPYIFFSIVEKEEKERIDKVTITPQPDTFIEFIAYFKGVDTVFPVIPLVLPQKPQERKGFAAVEWGGLIDR